MKGQKTGGRIAGTANKTTVAAREAFQLAFEGMGGVSALQTWANDNQTEFFKLYGRLIPVDVQQSGGLTVRIHRIVSADDADS